MDEAREMSVEERERMEAWLRETRHGYGEQNEDGIDLSLIRENLRRTPTERVRHMDRFSRGLLRLRDNARRIG